MNKKPIFIISGATAVGKSTIINELLTDQSLHLKKVITTTTRPKRPNETADLDRHFLTKQEFIEKVKNNDFLEHSQVYDNFYGIQKVDLKKIMDSEFIPILDIDIQGARKIKKTLKDHNLITIFIKYDSKESIKKRLATSDKRIDLKTRLTTIDKEEAEAKFYDYQIKNIQGKLNKTIKTIKEIIQNKI